MVRSYSQKGLAHILVLLVIIVAFGIFGWIYYNNSNNRKPDSPVTQVLPLPLTLDSPIDGALISDNKILVQGKTAPKVTVVFYTDTSEASVESDSLGNFEGMIDLSEGINTLTVIAFAENGAEKSLVLDIVNDSTN